MASTPDSPSKLPASAFSFTAPFPPQSLASVSAIPTALLKQRRVSLALPSSPRLFPAWTFRDDTGLGAHSPEASSSLGPEKKGKMRRIDSSERTDDDGPSTSQPQSEKKPRKKWSMEETQMLVAGCNKWGVGNWKSILNDPEFKFDNRSPVDLKDRFRTYFPDAYKQHYPNAKTHLSSKIRSSLPDGTSIFEKTRSKKRRPFTEEEDRALKAGYDKHGTVWATIVKDPIFQEQNRRSTDLRDRFRNAFPDLYQAAGYKPRTTAKKKQQPPQPVRAATDDQLAMASTSGPVRKRRHTTQGLYRGGTKSVPESTTCSEDEDSSEGEEDTPASARRDTMTSTSSEQSPPIADPFTAEVDMYTIDPLADTLNGIDHAPSSLSELTDSSQSQAWSTLDTPLHSSVWSGAPNVASPTSSQLSSNDYFMNNSPYSRQDTMHTMIGKSAWVPQDWLSANPRLEPSGLSSGSSSFLGGPSPTPSSPFSFANLSHGVLDRYDLFPPSLSHDFASEVGIGDSHSTFSDPEMFSPTSFRGFTHHSNYAGDLIFGARSHQPQQPFDYGPGFGFGSAGLGLSGLQQPQTNGIRPAQLRTPALPGIDEIELTSITLDDHVDMMEDTVDTALPKDEQDVPDLTSFALQQQTLEDIVGLTHAMHNTPPGTPLMSASMRNRSVSVPPAEHRVPMPRAAQTTMLRPKPLMDPALVDLYPLHSSEPVAAHPAPLLPPSYTSETYRPPGDYDLPFLDLHYYTASSSFGGGDSAEEASARQGLALDLAYSCAPAPPHKTPAASTSTAAAEVFVQQFPQAVGGRAAMHHHRGQSAVSPQDLLLRKGSDNKRKRSSWDGAR